MVGFEVWVQDWGHGVSDGGFRMGGSEERYCTFFGHGDEV